MIPQSLFGILQLVPMKKNILLLFICCFSFSVFSQITFFDDTWAPIGNTELRMRFDDADNGDGLNDGAISVDGKDTIAPLGASYTFQGTMQNICIITIIKEGIQVLEIRCQQPNISL